MERLEVICGILISETSQKLLCRMEELARQRGTAFWYRLCYSKQEVEHAVFRAGKHAVVLLQEGMDMDNPYQAWEAAGLRDIKDIPVVISVDRRHCGTAYLAVLYAAGIVDALYAEDADADHLTDRLLVRRDRRTCRDYYGIRSVEETAAVLEIMEEERLNCYIRHISGGAGAQDTIERYQDIERKLGFAENCFLAGHLPEGILEEIGEDAGILKYRTWGKGIVKGRKEPVLKGMRFL